MSSETVESRIRLVGENDTAATFKEVEDSLASLKKEAESSLEAMENLM